MNTSYLLLFTASVLLTACGGGGDGSGSTPTPIPTPVNFNVTTTVTKGGSISPTSQTVVSGQTATFNLNLEEGYKIDSVQGCAGTLNGFTYTTGLINANCTVSASFSLKKYTVVAVWGNGGTLTPVTQQIEHGQRATVTVQPNVGFTIDTISGCDGVLQGNIYTTAPVSMHCSINSTFKTALLTVDVASAVGGEILPRKLEVNYGQRAEFEIVAKPNFRFTRVTGCVGYFEKGRFVIPSVTKSCTLQPEFNDEQYVVFPDPVLDKAIRTQLKINNSDPIKTSQLQTELLTLFIDNSDLRTLDGLQYATNLNKLELFNNKYLTDISLIGMLAELQKHSPKLYHLSVQLSPILTLPDLSAMTQLATLYLSNTQISDLAGLANLLSLRNLDLSYTNVTSEQLLKISKIPLVYLNLSVSKVTDIQALANIPSIQNLRLRFGLFSNLIALQQLKELQYLDIAGSRVWDLSPLLLTNFKIGATLVFGGCFRQDNSLRVDSVIETLKKNGVVTSRIDNIAVIGGCPDPKTISAINTSSRFSNDSLIIDYDATTNDKGPWICEIHLNLDHQLPRVPFKIIEGCNGGSGQIVLDDLPLFEYDPYLIIDTGFLNDRYLKAVGRTNKSNMPTTAILSSHDWLQTVVKTAPKLVASKPAILRLHVTSKGNPTPIQLSVTAKLASKEQLLAVSSPAVLSAQKQHQSLTSSYNVTVPAEWMRPGASFIVANDNQQLAVLTPSFAKANKIDMTLVPIQVGTVISGLPADEDVINAMKAVWPLASVNIARRAPYVVKATKENNNSTTMIYELLDLRVAESGQSYYYGYFDQSTNTDGPGGLGFKPGTVAVGVFPDPSGYVLTHELGHNFSLSHAPCGVISLLDLKYPYANATLGSFGVLNDLTALLPPDDYRDVMSYCSPKHVSDYNYEIAQDYLERNVGMPYISLDSEIKGSLAAKSLSAVTSSKMLYVRGKIERKTQLVVEQSMIVDVSELSPQSSEYELIAQYSSGQEYSLPVQLLTLGHGHPADTDYFTFFAPIENSAGDLQNISIHFGDEVIFNQSLQTQMSEAKTTTKNMPSSWINERNNEVCVDLRQQSFDSVSFVLKHAAGTTALALAEQKPQFCRPTVELAEDGYWQLQFRRGLAVDVVDIDR